MSDFLQSIQTRILSIPSIWKRVIRSLILIAAVIGFTTQVIHVSIQYFEFKTSLQVLIQSPETASYYKVSLCFRFIDIVNLTRFNSATGADVKMPTSLDERIDLEDTMNIRQMFDYTPDVDDILKSCFYRPDDWNFKLMSGPDCRSFVNVSRYLTQEYMCYMFSLL